MIYKEKFFCENYKWWMSILVARKLKKTEIIKKKSK